MPLFLKFTAPTTPFPPTPSFSQRSLEAGVQGKYELQVIDGETGEQKGSMVGLQPEIPDYKWGPPLDHLGILNSQQI